MLGGDRNAPTEFRRVQFGDTWGQLVDGGEELGNWGLSGQLRGSEADRGQFGR
jgi:hypothetical protein